VHVQPFLQDVAARQEEIQRPAHVEGGEGHHRADHQPEQAVFAEGDAVQAAHQHHRQQELHRLVEGLHHAERQRAALQPAERDRLGGGVHCIIPWKSCA
jgi:hypothetical protein